MVRLLDACVQTLSQQGKRKMYIDAVRWGDAGFQSMGLLNPIFCVVFFLLGGGGVETFFLLGKDADELLTGFHKWARYREIWRDV